MHGFAELEFCTSLSPAALVQRRRNRRDWQVPQTGTTGFTRSHTGRTLRPPAERGPSVSQRLRAFRSFGAVILNTQALRDTIALAHRHEQVTGTLERWSRQRQSNLHHAIVVTGREDAEPLLGFATHYIEQVPELLETTASQAAEANLAAAIQPLLQLAVDYFLKPHELTTGRVGLEELLDEAYLAQRLVEEANDYALHAVGRPLSRVDLGQANLIIHHLIGEPFANELEEAVALACNRLYTDLSRIKRSPHSAPPRQRPCLAAQHQVHLNLFRGSKPERLRGLQ